MRSSPIICSRRLAATCAPRTAKRLQLARARRCGGGSRLVLWLLRRARRGGALRAAGEFGAFFQPCLVILRRIDDQCAFHSVMAEPTQLGANDFIGSRLNRREPDWN